MDESNFTALAAVVVAAAGVFVAWLKYRHDVRVRKQDLGPRVAKPFADVIHTVTYSSVSLETHSLKLEISNRDDWPIAVKEVCWYVKAFNKRWPLSFSSLLIPEPSDLALCKIKTADLMSFNVDIEEIFKPIFGYRKLPVLEAIFSAATIEVVIILTTGEVISLCTPWTFRAYLASQLVRPSWLVPVVKLYAWVHP